MLVYSDPMIRYSFLVPLYNESESIGELYRRLAAVAQTLEGSSEIIFIDDGSTDDSFARISEIALRDPRMIAIRFRRNRGKADALAVGARRSQGEIVVTLDADLQDRPEEIPALIAKLNEGYDMVAGWRRERRDPWGKTLPSRIFNAMVSALTNVRLHDVNCGLKAYRRDAVRILEELYGEMHRFIPAIAAREGFRVGEVPIAHDPRKFGSSKYGWSRFVKALFDLSTVLFLGRFATRPLHLFGSVGVLSLGVGATAFAYLSVLHFRGISIGARPLLPISIMLILAGLQLLFTGLLAELIVRKHRH